MRKLVAMVVGACLALFAFSALAAPDAAKVKYGAYAFVPVAAYSMPSAMPPTVAAESVQLTYGYVIQTSTSAVSAGAMPEPGAVSYVMIAYLGSVRPPAFNYLL